MVIQVINFKPFAVERVENHLHIRLASDSLTIEADRLIYQYLPLKWVTIELNLKTRMVENSDISLIFYHGLQTIKFRLRDLIMVSNISKFFIELCEFEVGSTQQETTQLLAEIMEYHYQLAIDESMFYQLTKVGRECNEKATQLEHVRANAFSQDENRWTQLDAQ